MRFTKIPLIATLMAVALSLLIVLPALAQVSGDRTDGKRSIGDLLDVRVAANLDDLDNMEGNSTPPSIAAGDSVTQYALDANNQFNARDTYFNGTLYVSNQEEAYNTILITASIMNGHADLAGTDTDDPCENVTGGAAIATIVNNRSGEDVFAYLLPAGPDPDNPVTNNNPGKTIYQGIVAVWDSEDSIDAHNAECAPHTDPRRWHPFGTKRADVGENDVIDNEMNPSPGTELDENDVPIGINDTMDDPPIDEADGWTHTGWSDGTDRNRNIEGIASAAVIPARDGDTITISVAGTSGRIQLVVDGEAPEIDDVTPSDGGLQKSSSVSLGFTVRDDGSGLRYDGEAGNSTDNDDSPHNGDGDQHFNEPLTHKAAGPDGMVGTSDNIGDGNGDTADIMVKYDKGNAANTESSQYGSNDWTEVTKGVEYQLDMRLVGQPYGKHSWLITAQDRVGNSVTTTSDDDKKDIPFTFKVDNKGPGVDYARTGIGYKPGSGETKNRSWIALNFVDHNKDGTVFTDGGAGSIEDRLDASTVEPSDFTVDGHTVMSVLVPSDKKVCNRDVIDPDNDPKNEKKEDADNIEALDAGTLGPIEADSEADPPVLEEKAATMCVFEPRARVYLELADELDGDETPTIQILGGALKDRAGNNNVTQSLSGSDVMDKIAPNVSVTITSSSEVSNRPATDEDGSFTVRIESDEDLEGDGFPELYFAEIGRGKASIKEEGAGTADKSMSITAISNEVKLKEGDPNTWEGKFKAEALSDNAILAVIVLAADDDGNSGNSGGWKDDGNPGPSIGDALDFKALNAGGFLVEVDSKLAPPIIHVLPAADAKAPEEGETESTNPYIQISFGESNEYGIAVTDDKGTETPDDDSPGTSYKVDIGDGDTAPTDSHRAVTLTSLKITRGDTTVFEHDMESEENLIEETDPGVFNIALSNLEVGEYTIAYTAVDDIGNERGSEDEPEEFDFEVLQRKPYGVELNPGWNLISLPGDPFNTSLAEVIGDLKANTVLGYQGGEWVTAVRNEDGSWQGTLTEIVGGYGYWVQTSVVEDIEVIIPPASPTQVLPSVPVVSGWNLLGVVDVHQRPVDEMAAMQMADQYFISLNSWRVAYSYNTRLNNWMKLIPDDSDANVANGKGYWVWVTKAGKLVP